ncbi:MAG TPA: LytTR family DNA-binding domain-containing protein [Prolixibacteraceae bacterium]|nr:LytTR family DNA-binding domain-containing protein [Prolixibacteraceae bacterium]
MQLNCLIVDDEPLSQEVLVDFVNECPELKLSGVCKDALEAGEKIQNQTIHLLLLDINMPRLSGISFIKSLNNPPLFILVTAYPEYALDGFEVDAVDYLLKPVSFERFRVAINRVTERISQAGNTTPEHIMVRSNKKNYRLSFDEILYLEAQGDYVKFKTAEHTLLVHGRLKQFFAQLPGEQFIQVHKSYIISISKVVYLEGNQVKIGKEKLPVSVNFKEQLVNKLGL